jgi:hypothetical protein
MTDFEQFGHNIHDRPKIGTSLGLVDYDFPKITGDQLKQRYGKEEAVTAKEEKPFFKKVLDSIFG